MANTIKCDIEWKLSLNNLRKYMREDQFLSSFQFANPQFPSVIWALRVYPNTKAKHADSQYETSGGFVSLIRKEPVNNTIKAKYIIYATDVKQMLRIDIATLNEFTFTTQQNESPKYSIDVLTAYEFKDPLIFYCEVEFKHSNVENEEIIIDLSEPSFTSHKSFNNMFENGILTDCVIKVGDEKINAHRCVLANNSEVFHRMFEQEDMIEAKNGEINIVDFSPECVRAMIDYFYNGEINKEILEKQCVHHTMIDYFYNEINDETLEKLLFELFAIAHKYEVKSLMDKCEYIIATRIDPKNFATCVDYLQLYNLPFLENACIKYIAAHRMTFLDSNEWKNLKELYKDKAFNLLESALKNMSLFNSILFKDVEKIF